MSLTWPDCCRLIKLQGCIAAASDVFVGLLPEVLKPISVLRNLAQHDALLCCRMSRASGPCTGSATTILSASSGAAWQTA